MRSWRMTAGTAVGVLLMTTPLLVGAPAAGTGVNAGVPVAPMPTEEVKPKKKKKEKLGVHTGPSKWRGRQLRHPSGERFSPAVLRWANLASGVLKELKIPPKYLTGVLAQIQQESSGNPKAINEWDINAVNGDPSRGLLQVIGSTYKMHAKPGYERLKFQAVPYTNLYAALNYVIQAYGMGKFEGWNSGANQGY